MKFTYYVFLILIIISFSFLYSYFSKNSQIDISNFSKSVYDYNITSIDGDKVKMLNYKGKKLLIVNVASKCGYTPQYAELQTLYERYSDKVVVLGFPSNDFLWQEPGTNQDIKKFCSTNYNISEFRPQKYFASKIPH